MTGGMDSTFLSSRNNFLPNESFNTLYRAMISHDFPWNLSRIVDDNADNVNRNAQMIHYFYMNHSPVSDTIQLLYPVLQILQPLAIIKIKANLVMGTDKIVEHGMHIDTQDCEDRDYIKTGILYMNTCNGYTKFENGHVEKSEANKFVFFNNSICHTGTTTSDATFRIVINFNYV